MYKSLDIINDMIWRAHATYEKAHVTMVHQMIALAATGIQYVNIMSDE